MDLHRMRREAVNYYNGSPREVQNLVYQFFRSMDVNGDGGVDFYEIQSFLRGRTFLTRFLSGDVYRQLDSDGNGTLDFYEFITLFYIIFMCFSCDVCRAPLRGQKHLTCVTCFTSAGHSGNTYDICGSCFSRGYFRHHHGYLADYYTLILNEGSSHGASNNCQQPVNGSQLTSGSPNSKQLFGQIHMALQAAAALSSIASVASAASCNIM